MNTVNRADMVGMHGNARALVLAAVIPIGVLEDGKNETAEESDSYMSQAEHLLDRAGRLNPRMVAVPYYKARLYATGAAKRPYETPEDLLKQALAIDPQHLPSREMLADIWAAQGKKKEALALLKESMEWPGTTPEYYAALAKLAKANGDTDLQDTALAKMMIGHGRKLANTFKYEELRSYDILE